MSIDDNAGMPRLVATIGMFDGVHIGHRRVVEQIHFIARERGMKSAIFTFVRHPMTEIRPADVPKAISTVAQRASLIVEAGADSVYFLNFNNALRSLTAAEFMHRLHTAYGVDVLVMGYNHHFGSDRLSEFDAYRRIGMAEGIEVIQACEHTIDSIDTHICSSEIRQALADGLIALANIMLGRVFAISGIVGHGRNIGHTIGFPTANVQPFLPNQLIPASGAYAAYAITGGGMYPAMVNVGVNPTVSADNSLKIEAHLIGYDGDLYGKVIEVGFIELMRRECKFNSLDDLKTQLTADKQQAYKIYTEWKSLRIN